MQQPINCKVYIIIIPKTIVYIMTLLSVCVYAFQDGIEQMKQAFVAKYQQGRLTLISDLDSDTDIKSYFIFCLVLNTGDEVGLINHAADLLDGRYLPHVLKHDLFLYNIENMEF